MPGLGLGISPFFYKPTGGSTPPTSLLQSWYDSLSVKPSAGLWSDLNTLADTLNAAGKWAEFDFFAMIAAMETDEQRLRPLITTSGSDITAVNSPTLDANGVTGNGTSSYLNFNWNPTAHSVKFTLNNSCYGVYNSTAGTTGNRRYMGVADTNGVTISNSEIVRTTTLVNGRINSNGAVATITANLTTFGLKSIRRIDSNNVRGRSNASDGTNVIQAVVSRLANSNFVGCCTNNPAPLGSGPTSFSNATMRLFFMGSNVLASDDVLYNALTTFFTARGLSTF